MNVPGGLTDVPGLLVGHATDAVGLTGCTAVLCPGGAVAGVEVRGWASGVLGLDLLDPRHLAERIHAVVLAGGSAFPRVAARTLVHAPRGEVSSR